MKKNNASDGEPQLGRRDFLASGSSMVMMQALLAGTAGPPLAQSTPQSAQSTAVSAKPNIVFILADNLGYGDIGPFGGGDVSGAPTPRLDAMAREGLRLTNFNVEPECTPSRSALMTGRMPIRSGTSKVAIGGLPEGISTWEYTLALLLSDSGYQTAMYGKWHLGDRQGRFPSDRGFDEWWGFPHSTDESLRDVQPGWSADVAPLQPIYEGRKGSPSVKVADYTYEIRPFMGETITQKAVAYIKAHAGNAKPFFLYVALSSPHAPPIPNPKFHDKRRTNYQNVLTEIDFNSGQIFDALKQAGVDDNTLVVWCSDNGPESLQGPGIIYGAQGDSGPFRSEFPSAWEGAIRTACLMRWPGRIQAGRSSNEIFCILDFYRTFAKIVGAAEKVPTDRPIDSIDQSSFLLGKQEKSDRESAMYFHSGELLAIKWRNFKGHLKVRVPAESAVRQAGQGVVNGYNLQLNYPWIFNIEDDPKELWNINTASSWVSVAMAKVLVEYKRSIQAFPNLMPGGEGPAQHDPEPDTTPSSMPASHG
jgi:arylsulfatase